MEIEDEEVAKPEEDKEKSEDDEDDGKVCCLQCRAAILL